MFHEYLKDGLKEKFFPCDSEQKFRFSHAGDRIETAYLASAPKIAKLPRLGAIVIFDVAKMFCN